MFSSSDNEQSVPTKIKINRNFAKKYKKRKQKEEISRISQTIKSINGDSDSESTTEDSDANELTYELDKDFSLALLKIKQKDPSIYQKDTKFYKEEYSSDISSSFSDYDQDKKDEKFTVLDMEQKLLKEKGKEGSGSQSEDSGSESESSNEENTKKKENYYEEQSRLKRELLESLNSTNKNSNQEKEKDQNNKADEDDGDIFLLKKKSTKELSKEEEDYRKFLTRLDEQKKMRELRKKVFGEFWKKKEFLNDVEVNFDQEENPLGFFDEKNNEDEDGKKKKKKKKGYKNKDSKVVFKYTQEEFLKNYLMSELWNEKGNELYEIINEDSEEDIETNKFEKEYNFRYEEKGGTKLKPHQRKVTDSLRNVKNPRKEKRLRRKDKKKIQEKKKKEEINRMKNLKSREIQLKLQQIRNVTGNTVVGFKMEDLEKDFDLETWEKRMEQIFNQDYFEDKENSDEEEFSKINNEEEDEEDEDEKSNKNEKEKKNNRKRKQLEDELEKGKQIKEELDHQVTDLFKLNYEDIIGGDTLTRFNYSKVKPNTYGLSYEEMLYGPIQDLNKRASLKKMAPYRKDGDNYYSKKYQKRKRPVNHKKRRKNSEWKTQRKSSFFSHRK
ncbi:zinc finger zz type [Anaeramoeba flamelloides]|uniref:Zinc finger zz type n=1 Tax=Anaeramoeba flamelloides TaxID=1746091 RepID=A0AAV7YUL0_9EUKA|nr:zinc finger zz type [Anaeramoeba flamelloides]